MHFKFLIEDQSGKKALETLVPKIIGDGHSFNIHAYKGIGRIPRKLGVSAGAGKRILLDQLPRLLRGHGKTFDGYSGSYPAAVILVCDLDKRCLADFRKELFDILHACDPKPETRFCIAIEEGEAWFLGDIPAVKKAYPKAKDNVLNGYENDSICGAWELLADAIYRGGSQALKADGWQAIGAEKSVWSEKITPHMTINENKSPSFRYFVAKLHELAVNEPM